MREDRVYEVKHNSEGGGIELGRLRDVDPGSLATQRAKRKKTQMVGGAEGCEPPDSLLVSNSEERERKLRGGGESWGVHATGNLRSCVQEGPPVGNSESKEKENSGGGGMLL